MGTRASFIPLLLGTTLLALALCTMQLFTGGTRMVFSLPVYGLLGLAGIVAAPAIGRPRVVPGRLCLWSAAIFFGYILVRAWFSPVAWLARSDALIVLGGLVVYLATGFILTGARWRMAIVFVLLAAALVQAGIGAIQYRDGNNFMLIPFLQRFDYGRRASGFYVCPNHFAGLLEVLGLFCLSLVCWSRCGLWVKLLIGYAGVICYAALALTGSRGGYLSAGASLLVTAVLTVIALRRAERRVFRRTIVGGAILAALLGGLLLWGFAKSDFLASRAQKVADRENVRLDLWRAALEQWKLEPLAGTGSGTYLYYGRRFRSENVQLDPVEVHNDYLQLLAEYGAVGGALFLFFLGAHLWQGGVAFHRLGPRRMATSTRVSSNNLALNIGALGAVAACLVHSVFDFNLHIPANALLLGFVFGILANPGFERETETGTKIGRWLGRLALALLGLLLMAAAWRYVRAEYYAERARVALRDERHLAAGSWALRAVALDARNPEIWFYLGESRIRQAEEMANRAAARSFYEAAIEPLQRAVALAPNDETFLIALGRVYDALGWFAEAEWMFGRAKDWDPRSDVTRKSYAAHLRNWRRGFGVSQGDPKLTLPDASAPLPANPENPAPN